MYLLLLRAVIGLRDLLEVFGNNDLGRETTQPDSLLTHTIDESFSSIYLYLSGNGTAFHALGHPISFRISTSK